MRKLVIIGSGPAGLTAAIYAARADLAPLVVEGIQPGGQLTITTEVENYPGLGAGYHFFDLDQARAALAAEEAPEEGIYGPPMMDLFRAQSKKFGAEHMEYSMVTSVDFSVHPFKITIDETLEEEAESIIIATGASARFLGLENEQKLMGFGVSACATCDGSFFRDKEVVVVGGGDTAMEEANFLTKFCTRVTLVHRRDAFRASRIMQDRVLKNPKVDVIWNSQVTDVHTETGKEVVAVTLEDTQTGESTHFPTGGLFVAIGHTPNTKVFEGKLDLDPSGYMIVDQNVLTSVPGVFAAGDVADTRYRQAITAAGLGCMSALEAERWLEAREG